MTRVANISQVHARQADARQESFAFQRPEAVNAGPPRRARHRKGRIRAFLRRVVAFAFLIALLLLGIAWYQGYTAEWAKAAEDKFIAVTLDSGFALARITAEGQVRTPDAAILEALAVTAGDPLFAMDMSELRKRVEALPWVRQAVVTREWPDTVKVRVMERVPYARWQIDGHVVLVDDTGARIPGADTKDFAALPFIVGPGAPKNALALFDMIAATPDIAGRIVAAVRVGERRWDLEFDNGMRLKLPEPSETYGEAEAWAAFLKMERERNILGMDVAVFDLRLPDRIMLRLTPEGQKIFESEEQKT